MIIEIEELMVILGPSSKYMNDHNDENYKIHKARGSELTESGFLKLIEKRYRTAFENSLKEKELQRIKD